MGIPSALKFKNGNLKYILKRAARGLVPPGVLARPKQGFGLPMAEWFQGRLGKEAEIVLTRFCKNTDLLDAAAVRRILDRRESSKIWYLLNFALWWEAHIAQ